MTYEDRKLKSEEAVKKILEEIKRHGAEVIELNRPASDALNHGFSPYELLNYYYPDCAYRWPGGRWGLMDAKASTAIELAAYKGYVLLSRIDPRPGVIVCSPNGWQQITEIETSPTEAVTVQAVFDGHIWDCPRLGKQRNDGSGTPWTGITNYRDYAEFPQLKHMLEKGRLEVAIEAAYKR